MFSPGKDLLPLQGFWEVVSSTLLLHGESMKRKGERTCVSRIPTTTSASYEGQRNKNTKTEFLHARSWLPKGSLSPEEVRSCDFVCCWIIVIDCVCHGWVCLKGQMPLAMSESR